jgi:hypothetical protein
MKLRKYLMKIFKVFVGLVFKVKVAICWDSYNQGKFFLRGSYPLVGRHVVNETKVSGNVGCHVVNETKVA